jgi:hypothetical protein
VKLHLSVLSILGVAVLAVLATTFRVSTAPERIRMRLESAKATCVGAGGEWIKVDGEEVCRPAAKRSQP